MSHIWRSCRQWKRIIVRANKIAREGELAPNPSDRVWDGDEEEDWKLALLNEVKENFLREMKVMQPRSKGKRELLNLESSINYGIASRPSRRRKGKTIVL